MERAATEPSRVVVGVDGSAASRGALRWAVRIAAATGAEITAVTAWQFPTTYGGSGAMEDWRPDLDAQTVLEQTLAEVFPAERPPGLRTVVAEGQARDVLLSASDGAEMLVVGSRGHGGFAGLLLGSVSAACAEHARCPVLVVHGEQA
jgi:nucleotide-binding universal stress UspA family protein